MKSALSETGSDESLFALCRERLYSAVIGDVMDSLGLTRQFLPPEIQPLRESLVVVGRAMPVLEADDAGGEGPERAGSTMNQPFGLMLQALDDLQAGEVYLCTGSSMRYALWGELMTRAARNRGAAGAVVNGFSRDTKGILKQDFPVFSRGRYAQDQRPRGKVVDFRCPIRCGDVDVSPGDLVFGDWEGVCIVPKEVEQDVVREALEKAEGEKAVYKAIREGMGAQEAWKRYGIF